MSFRIIGDEIEYEFRPFARIVAPACSVLRDRAEEEIEACDSAKREREDREWCDGLEAEHAKEVEALESKITELEAENEKLHLVLSEIDDGDTCLDLIAKAQAEAAEWRRIAEHNRDVYQEAMKPKPRKRRTF